MAATPAAKIRTRPIAMTYSGQRARMSRNYQCSGDSGTPGECRAPAGVISGIVVPMPRWIPILAVALALVAPGTADAKRKKQRYYFEIGAVDLADGIPAEVADRVRAQMGKELSAHDIILTELPAAAPDPKAAPKRFKKFLKRHKIRAFTIKIDVTEYTRQVEEMPEGRRGKRLKVSVSLRMFGETIPDRSMGFAGAGSAAIKLEVGSKVRERDEQEAHEAAFEPAVADAVAESLRKLQLPPPSQQAKKKRRKK